MLGFLLGVAIGAAGFALARRFVISRLRFVDAIRSPLAPIMAGLLAAVVTWPLAVLPILTTGMSALFWIGAGIGTASGVKALKRGEV